VTGMISIHFALLVRHKWRGFCARRRRSRGHCDSCGYSLTGNVAGICPECGLRISVRPSQVIVNRKQTTGLSCWAKRSIWRSVASQMLRCAQH